MRVPPTRFLTPWVVALGLLVPGLAHAQGFGFIRKNVSLYRAIPPAVNLTNTRVAIRLTGVGGRPTAVTDLLRAKLIPLVFSDRTIAEDNANPDRVIEVSVTDFNATTEVDPKDRARVVKGIIRAAYRTIDNRTSQSLDARNLGWDYEQRFAAEAKTQAKPNPKAGFLEKLGTALSQVPSGVQPPTVEQLTTQLVETLAAQIAQRVVLTPQKLDVPLPRGRLDPASELGEAGRWGAMLETLEQMAPLPGDDDAYRRYGIGVANEALAYVEADRSKQRDLIARASQEYKAALAIRSGDDTFQSAEDRIAQSLAALDQAAALAQTGPATAAPDAGSRARGGAGAGSTWDNAAVIELFKEGFKDPDLIAAIKAAPTPQFDVDSPAGLLQLKRAGVTGGVIEAMRERMKAGN